MEKEFKNYEDYKDDCEKVRVRLEVGILVRQAREARGWSRYELAKQSGLGETHVAKIEEGAYSVRVDIFNKLCKTLGIEATFPIA